MKIGDYRSAFHLTCHTQSQAVAARRVGQSNHKQKLPEEGLQHCVLLSASTGADHIQ